MYNWQLGERRIWRKDCGMWPSVSLCFRAGHSQICLEMEGRLPVWERGPVGLRGPPYSASVVLLHWVVPGTQVTSPSAGGKACGAQLLRIYGPLVFCPLTPQTSDTTLSLSRVRDAQGFFSVGFHSAEPSPLSAKPLNSCFLSPTFYGHVLPSSAPPLSCSTIIWANFDYVHDVCIWLELHGEAGSLLNTPGFPPKNQVSGVGWRLPNSTMTLSNQVSGIAWSLPKISMTLPSTCYFRLGKIFIPFLSDDFEGCNMFTLPPPYLSARYWSFDHFLAHVFQSKDQLPEEHVNAREGAGEMPFAHEVASNPNVN